MAWGYTSILNATKGSIPTETSKNTTSNYSVYNVQQEDGMRACILA